MRRRIIDVRGLDPRPRNKPKTPTLPKDPTLKATVFEQAIARQIAKREAAEDRGT